MAVAAKGSFQRNTLAIKTGLAAMLEAKPRLCLQLENAAGEVVHITSTPIAHEAVAVQVRPILNGYAVAHRGVSVDAWVYTRTEAKLVALMPEKKIADTSKSLLCPMPGLVKAIYVKDGQEIKAGEPLCMVEAMKMENVLRAERDTVVKKINAKEGDSLAVDAVIMEFA